MSAGPAAAALDRRALGTFAFAHACSDLCQGAVPALLAFFVLDRGYSYAEAGSLVLAASIGGSVVQPLFGLRGDRVSSPWLVPGGLLLGGLGIGLVGLAGAYPLALLAIACSGLGVAAFHPEAARWASIASGPRRATGLSVFSIGGNAGFALGPLLVTPLVLVFGLHATPALALLPLAGAVLSAGALRRLQRGPRSASRGVAADGSAPSDAWWPFARLAALIGLQTGLAFALLAFVPLYLITSAGASKVWGNAAATVLLVAGAFGTLVGGHIADRVGRRPVLAAPQLVLLPAVLALPSQGLAGAFLVLVVIGVAMDANFSTALVLGQEYLPDRIGLAAGLILGVSVGIGGLVSAALGALADATSLETALYAVASFPLATLALALTLPEPAPFATPPRSAVSSSPS